ncbi:MAG: hypothetical protein WCJ49_03665 [Deltaproteobacteria bacterium]
MTITAKPHIHLPTPREVQPGDKEKLDALMSADPSMLYNDYISQEERARYLTFATPEEIMAGCARLVNACGKDFYDVVKAHSHDKLGMTIGDPSFDIYGLMNPPAPAGSIQPTSDPAEILARAEVGRDCSGNPPCDAAELVVRKAILTRVLAKDSRGIRDRDWFKASEDALKVLILGLGFNPYVYILQPGHGYPYRGIYDLEGICELVRSGGSVG